MTSAAATKSRGEDFGGAGKGFRSDSRAEGHWSHGGTPAAATKSRGEDFGRWARTGRSPSGRMIAA